jgi:hypothetical protein
MFTKQLQKSIKDTVKKTFNNLRLRLLGPEHVSRALVFSLRDFDPKTTLANLYTHANALNSIDPKSIDKATIDKLTAVASGYLDGLEQKSIADVTRIIGEHYDNLNLIAKQENKTTQDVMATPEGEKIVKKLKKDLREQNKKIDKAAEQIIGHELRNGQQFGSLDSILGASKAMGVDDPIVFKIGDLTNPNRCKHCWTFWNLSDKKTPRLYRLSELAGSPGNWKNPVPSVGLTHVNCSDILTLLAPGFGLNESGKITYYGPDHDPVKKQRS